LGSNDHNFNINAASTLTKAGSLIYAGIGNFPCGKAGIGHAFVIESADPSTGDISVRDPAECISRQKFLKMNIYTSGFGGTPMNWYWAIPIKPQ